jgi:hypothetical protein
MKKTSIAMCAVLFGALFISNAFANTGDVVATTVDAAAVTTTGEAAATEAVAAEATTGEAVAAETTTGDVTTGAVATTGDVATGAVATTGDVATGAVAAEATTGDVATGSVATTGEAEVSINDTLHAILDKYFEDNASKFNTAKDRKDFFETVKANINKAAEKAKEAQKEAFEIIKGALETYEIK